MPKAAQVAVEQVTWKPITVDVRRVTILAAAIAAVVLASPVPRNAWGQAAAAPASGITVHRADIHDAADSDLGGAAAISLAGARNGAFSGKVVVRSAQAIQGLKGIASALKGADGVIPPAQVQVRYAVAWERMSRRPKGNDILLEAPLAEFPVAGASGATVPVWVTVRVPKDAKAGTYAGQLTIESKGAPPVTVPLKIDVQDHTLPDTQDYRAWLELIQSPDTLAMEYGLPFWSDKHWQMIGKSLKLIGEAGSRVVYIPLICHTNQGNEHSMVRWISKGDGRYDYDFSVMDKYLDQAEKNMGKPKIVVFYVWDVFLNPPTEAAVTIKEDDSPYQKEEKARMAARTALKGKGPPVTVVDPATGETKMVYLPQYSDPASRPLWQPVWKGIRERMRKRGLEDAMMLGISSDWRPTKEDLTALQEMSGDLPWSSCSHHAKWLFGTAKNSKGELLNIARVGYTVTALGYQYVLSPDKERLYGWKKKHLHGQYWRFDYFNTSSLATIRGEEEANITGNQRGIAHLGGDMWFAVRDKRGSRRGSVVDRYVESYWHSLNIYGWMLGPGPDGPVATARFEVLREGVQECEARIALESVLTDAALRAKLGDDLAKRAQSILDERQRGIWKARGASDKDLARGFMRNYREIYSLARRWNSAAGTQWFIKSSWQDRDAKLFAVAGEVARKVKR